MFKPKKPPLTVPAETVQIMLSVINPYPELVQRVQYEYQVLQQDEFVDILLSVISQYKHLVHQVGYQNQLLQQKKDQESQIQRRQKTERQKQPKYQTLEYQEAAKYRELSERQRLENLQLLQQYYPQGEWQSGNEVQGTIMIDTNEQQQPYTVVRAEPYRVVAYGAYPVQGTPQYFANTS